jgi:hypothetical protein
LSQARDPRVAYEFHTSAFKSVVRSNTENFPALLSIRILADDSAGTTIDIPVAPLDEMTQWPIRLYPHH